VFPVPKKEAFRFCPVPENVAFVSGAFGEMEYSTDWIVSPATIDFWTLSVRVIGVPTNADDGGAGETEKSATRLLMTTEPETVVG
jgi:hypothetical protein